MFRNVFFHYTTVTQIFHQKQALEQHFIRCQIQVIQKIYIPIRDYVTHRKRSIGTIQDLRPTVKTTPVKRYRRNFVASCIEVELPNRPKNNFTRKHDVVIIPFLLKTAKKKTHQNRKVYCRTYEEKPEILCGSPI